MVNLAYLISFSEKPPQRLYCLEILLFLTTDPGAWTQNAFSRIVLPQRVGYDLSTPPHLSYCVSYLLLYITFLK